MWSRLKNMRNAAHAFLYVLQTKTCVCVCVRRVDVVHIIPYFISQQKQSKRHVLSTTTSWEHRRSAMSSLTVNASPVEPEALWRSYALELGGSEAAECPFSDPSPPAEGISSGTQFRSDLEGGLSGSPSPDLGGAAPFTHTPPSDLPKLNSLPGLKALLGDRERSWELLPDDEDEEGGAATACVLVEAPADAAAPSFLFSGDLRNLKLRKPGSLGSVPVGD